MLPQNTYTKIYATNDDYGNFQLLLYNEISNESLFFDGLDFSYKSSTIAPSSGLKELKGKNSPSNTAYEITAIRQSDDITFIKFSNGNLFQIHTMPNGYNGFIQVLSIYEKTKDSLISTPLGINSYEAALLRMDNAEECEIDIE
jgi:hypothetical protein